jgi:hypothetical protein
MSDNDLALPPPQLTFFQETADDCLFRKPLGRKVSHSC